MKWNKQEIIDLVAKMNDYWITERKPETQDSGWVDATYYVGCMGAYRLTGDRKYLDNALAWADKNHWEYRKFEKPAVPLYYNNGDNYNCLETYFQLLEYLPGCDKGQEANMLKEIDLTLNDPESNHWKWTDLIYMAMPAFHICANKFKDDRYLEKAHQLFIDIRDDRALYDTEDHLWYRDANYLPDQQLTPNGKKIFWGRGNGWAVGGIARALSVTSKDMKYYEEYRQTFVEMIDGLIPWQQEDGFWRCSIVDPAQFDVPETSGTVLISYGMALAIEIGILDREKYLPHVLKAFEAMITVCINEEGRLGYVQRIAAAPGPVAPEDSNGYAVGAFTLLCESLIHLGVIC